MGDISVIDLFDDNKRTMSQLSASLSSLASLGSSYFSYGKIIIAATAVTAVATITMDLLLPQIFRLVLFSSLHDTTTKLSK